MQAAASNQPQSLSISRSQAHERPCHPALYLGKRLNAVIQENGECAVGIIQNAKQRKESNAQQLEIKFADIERCDATLLA